MTIVLYQNSLITLEDAQTYFDERYDSNNWLQSDTTTQEKLLVSASKKISTFDFVGRQESAQQPLAFPRDFDLPQDIKDAVCEEAISLISKSNDAHFKNQESNISSISLGVGSVSYNQTDKTQCDNVLCSEKAKKLINKWIKKGFSF